MDMTPFRIRKAVRCSAHPVILSTLLCSLLSGCGPKNFVNENDKLREQNLKLTQQVDELNKQMELRLGEIETLRAQSAGERAIKEADPPVLAKIEFARYSSAVDTNADGKDDLIRVYLTPLDHKGRMLPVSGRLKIQAVTLQDDAPPALLAARTYEPDEFDAAYRANFTGYHYTIELPLPESLDPATTSATVKITFTEAVTGAEHSEEKIIKIKAE
ncbi:MAG: hypothetical protein R3C45_17210 [Phycisphaerales bacterium]